MLYSRRFVQSIGPGGADDGEGEQVGNRARSGASSRQGRRRDGTGPVHRSICSVAADLGEPSAESGRVPWGETSSRAHRFWGKPRAKKAGARNDRGPDVWHTVGRGRNRQDPAMAAKFGENDRETGEVREEPTPSIRDPGLVTVRVQQPRKDSGPLTIEAIFHRKPLRGNKLRRKTALGVSP